MFGNPINTPDDVLFCLGSWQRRGAGVLLAVEVLPRNRGRSYCRWTSSDVQAHPKGAEAAVWN